MISLALRLTLKGGRESGVRLALTALGVAVGVALLLFTLGGFSGLKQRDARQGWLSTSPRNTRPSVDERTSSPLLWRPIYDSFGSRSLTIVEVAALGPHSPVPPGLARVPRAGEYFVSPALARLLATTPADALGDRLPGRCAGLVGRAALESPDSLVAFVGQSAHELRRESGTFTVRSIETLPYPHTYTSFFKTVLALGAAGLLVPVLMFVATSTRLAAARREERFAALRLVGATPRQVNQIATIEAALGAVIGVAAGFAGFYALRPVVARIPFTGEPFFTGDLSLGWRPIAAVAVGVPLAAALVALWSLRRVRISPLGVSRQVGRRPPRVWRLLPAALGLGVLALAPVLPLPEGNVGIWVIPAGFIEIVVGLTIAGPWFTMVGARLLARLARGDATLIAARRLSAQPGQAFRTIGGLVLAVFVGTVFIGVVDTAISHGNVLSAMTLPKGTVVESFFTQPRGALAPRQAAPLLARLRGLPGVRVVVPLYARRAGGGPNVTDPTGLVSAAAWDRLAVYGPAAGDTGRTIVVEPGELLYGGLRRQSTWSAASVRATALRSHRLIALLATTDGSVVAVERVRTALELALPQYSPPETESQLSSSSAELVDLLQRMVDVGIILTLVIAGCSLAVASAGGLIERKRPFTLLRLSGMPIGHLRRVVVLEAAVPLVVAALVAAGACFLAADFILYTTSHDYGVAAPGLGYYELMVGGLLAALGVVCVVMPLLDRMTQPQTARAE
jgi:hypothetical protein